MFQNKTIMALSAAGLLFVSAVNAADEGSTTPSNTANMHVKLTVLAACTLAVDEMDFGRHQSNEASKIDVNANATVTCTKGIPYVLKVNEKHTYAMKKEGETITVPYKLYTDAAHGQTVDDTDGIHGTGTGSDQGETVPIYGEVTAAALQAAPAGDYADDVTLVVTY
ncbi:TPA: spore coat protein U domain-containing protein [Pluralibacter gergoviae]|uniref:Spore coat protein U/FanG domain-containing protein n=1 Tax=Pluralibacter gergoviae TaxID=61647 RepID=A0A0J5KUH6_PLUGE|nr:spore coat protein U domain-containing protein [Pluralibacter gergoviae]KMK11216.1 hypothetical protein ABW06_22480 [Pluralibacter gergoviae]KMK20937.1 hypothetical protein ABW10_22265 [Pluralibacter gergoviae]MBL3694274.1 spore coat protein U domain-containing protein [Pluralibacter gergoviae]HDS1149938.1 spore coat protein U domain-containing protein [Pluralibacter gergoviae]